MGLQQNVPTEGELQGAVQLFLEEIFEQKWCLQHLFLAYVEE